MAATEDSDSDDSTDMGMKPPLAEHVRQSAQDRLNKTWKKFANAFDCNRAPQEQLQVEEDHLGFEAEAHD